MEPNHHVYRELARQHYDSYAEPGDKSSGNERDRREGKAFPLKRFHNAIKKELLMTYAKDASFLLDIACGRGGDINKWIDARIERVLGLDLSGNEIAEAKKRFNTTEAWRKKNLECEFVETDKVDMERFPFENHCHDKHFDVVTCMFAIHYFFHSEQACKNLFMNITSNLKVGGHFICCFPDAKRVLTNLDNKEHLSLPSLELRKHWTGEPKCFGSPYLFSLRDTVTEVKSDNAPYEFLVFNNVILGLAQQYGLRPVVDYPRNLTHLFEEADRDKPFKHFRPQFPPESDPSLATASAINVCLVMEFQGFPKTKLSTGAIISGNGTRAPQLHLQEHQKPIQNNNYHHQPHHQPVGNSIPHEKLDHYHSPPLRHHNNNNNNNHTDGHHHNNNHNNNNHNNHNNYNHNNNHHSNIHNNSYNSHNHSTNEEDLRDLLKKKREREEGDDERPRKLSHSNDNNTSDIYFHNYQEGDIKSPSSSSEKSSTQIKNDYDDKLDDDDDILW
jgi:mRNA (guanine-N7-)-methyltransferase